MKKIQLIGFIIWSFINIAGMFVGALSWRITGTTGWGLLLWCGLWELYVLHRLFECLEEK